MFYLEEGSLSKFTPLLTDISDEISGEGVQLLNNIFLKVKSLLKVPAENYFSSEEFEKKLNLEHLRRSAEEIVKSEYHYGCDEFGVVIATIARIKKIPTKYIQCVELISYKTMKSADDINGHVFLECFLENKKYLVNSTKGTIVEIKKESDKNQLYVIKTIGKRRFYVEVFAGLDSWDAGIRSHHDLIKVLNEFGEAYFKNTETLRI